MQEGGLGIDVDGRADLARDFLGGDVFAVKLAVFVVEKIHRGGIIAGIDLDANLFMRKRVSEQKVPVLFGVFSQLLLGLQDGRGFLEACFQYRAVKMGQQGP